MTVKKQVPAAMASSPDGNVRINRQKKGSGAEYYEFPHEKKLARKEGLVMETYLMEDAMPAIGWKNKQRYHDIRRITLPESYNSF